MGDGKPLAPRAVEEWVHARQPGKKEDASEGSKGDVRRTAGKKVPGAKTKGVESRTAGQERRGVSGKGDDIQVASERPSA